MKSIKSFIVGFALLASPVFGQSIVDEINDRDSFSSLAEALSGSELEETLNNSNGITFFAPNNDAFERLPDGFLDYLNSNPELITELINFHIIDEALTEDDIARMNNLSANTKGELKVKALDFGLYLNSSKVLETDSADNGIVHEIDRFLIPPSLFDQAPANEEASTDDSDTEDTEDEEDSDEERAEEEA